MFQSCHLGQLTKTGIHQVIQFGTLLRERYVLHFDFLSKQFTPRDINIRSSFYSRTIETAQAFVLGLYPDDYRSKNDNVHIFTNSNHEDSLYPGCGSCPKYQYLISSSLERDTEKSRKSQIKDIIQHSPDQEFWEKHDTLESANILNTFISHNFPLPPGVTLEQYQHIRKLTGEKYQEIFGNDDVRKISIGLFLQDLYDDLQNSIFGHNKVKLNLYAGHDFTLGPLMMSLGIIDTLHPPMGSALVIEYFKKRGTDEIYVKPIFWNGNFFEEKKFSDSTLTPLQELIDKIQTGIPVDFLKECSLD